MRLRNTLLALAALVALFTFVWLYEFRGAPAREDIACGNAPRERPRRRALVHSRHPPGAQP